MQVLTTPFPGVWRLERTHQSPNQACDLCERQRPECPIYLVSYKVISHSQCIGIRDFQEAHLIMMKPRSSRELERYVAVFSTVFMISRYPLFPRRINWSGMLISLVTAMIGHINCSHTILSENVWWALREVQSESRLIGSEVVEIKYKVFS